MDIADWREKIDELDRQLVELLNQRCRYAQAIGDLKRGRSIPIYEPDRERQIFENVSRINKGPLSDGALHHVFERIIDEMRSIQRQHALEPANDVSNNTAASEAGNGVGPQAGGASGNAAGSAEGARARTRSKE